MAKPIVKLEWYVKQYMLYIHVELSYLKGNEACSNQHACTEFLRVVNFYMEGNFQKVLPNTKRDFTQYLELANSQNMKLCVN